jgi:UDP-N-acetylmuramoylalanine--D-glutamate ligase
MTRSPQVAAVLNITPNHLDRHRNMQAYTAAKANILNFQNEQGAAVLGRDDPGAWSLRHQVHGRLLSFGFSPLPEGQEGAFLNRGMLMLRSGGSETPVMPESQVALRGRHNLLNVLAACAIAEAARLPSQAIPAGVKDFRGVPHRLEFIRSWGGADWYNDSIATAPERVMAAIRSFEEPLVLLVGGRDKKLPWEPLAELASRRVEHLVVFGEAADKILQAFHSIQTGPNPLPVTRTITRCATLQEAVQAAAHIVQPGEIVLLSPGGTSFDEFRDFEERGKCFTRLVKALP